MNQFRPGATGTIAGTAAKREVDEATGRVPGTTFGWVAEKICGTGAGTRGCVCVSGTVAGIVEGGATNGVTGGIAGTVADKVDAVTVEVLAETETGTADGGITS